MRRNIQSGIYCIENNTTKKKYIGQSINIDDRWIKHKSDLNKGTHDNDYLQNAWNKYGEKDFSFYVLEFCDKDVLDEREIYYMDLKNVLNREFGYNLKTGGQNSGVKVSEYARKKLSNTLKQRYQNNEELREIQRERALKQWANPDIKEKIMGKNNGMYGKHHTDEARRKMAESRKGTISPYRNRTPVFCEELNKRFEDATTASKELNLHSECILMVCQGKRKTTGGYHWKFLLEK